MSRLVVISNRLPASLRRVQGQLRVESSAGGLATALRSVFNPAEHLWIGWPGTTVRGEAQRTEVNTLLQPRGFHPVFLTPADIRGFYEGFSNKTLWPLFHYFLVYAQYNEAYWRSYERVNRLYFEAVQQVARPDDVFWVHDYQLLLLPQLLRQAYPEASIGFFLHIPFPSYELFRLLPWRREILEGMLGADLVGLHTYDYVRHFLSAAKRTLGLDERLGQLRIEGRMVDVDAMPISIDCQNYADGPRQPRAQVLLRRLDTQLRTMRLLLSIDRLDYSKGILQRLKALDLLLERHPEFIGQLVLYLVVVPSRDNVDQYATLKAEIDQYVGYVNGKYGSVAWAPVQYQYSSLRPEMLMALYHRADLMLVTPMRDGMNLVAKEFVIAKNDRPGVLVLSELAGAAYELAEGALLVNPNHVDSLAAALLTGLQMPVAEQLERLARMQHVIRQNDVNTWAKGFLDQLDTAVARRRAQYQRQLRGTNRATMLAQFRAAKRRLILLDYDGTLRDFTTHPEQAVPDDNLLDLLGQLTRLPHTDIVLISGRDKATLDRWFGHLDLACIAEHGLWQRAPRQDWTRAPQVAGENDDWMPVVSRVMEAYALRTPGSHVERKARSLAWHYRAVDPNLGELRVAALHNSLLPTTQQYPLNILRGNKVLEVRNALINKGIAALALVQERAPDFVLALGDDVTDEDLFQAMPPTAWTIKVGTGDTLARNYLGSVAEVHLLLRELVQAGAQPPRRKTARTSLARAS